MSSENIGLLHSRSVSQPRLNISVTVSLDDNLWITELFVTKPSMVINHYKPECHVQKMGCYLQGQGHSNWVWVHTMKSWLFLLYIYMFWTADFVATNLVWQCMLISWSILWKGCFAVFKVTVKVLNFNKCLPGQYLWSIRLNMLMHHHLPEHHSKIFCYVQGQSHNRFN